MSKYVRMIGKKARKAIENKVDSTTKNKVLKKFLVLLKKNQNIGMFCTGGIRCEKASAYLKKKGFKKKTDQRGNWK